LPFIIPHCHHLPAILIRIQGNVQCSFKLAAHTTFTDSHPYLGSVGSGLLEGEQTRGHLMTSDESDSRADYEPDQPTGSEEFARINFSFSRPFFVVRLVLEITFPFQIKIQKLNAK
jgi:hypothetical protein